MSKELKQPKQPRTIEVKTLIPWIIILVFTAVLIGAVTGWTMRSDQVSLIESEVAKQVKTTATPAKKQ